MFHLHSATKEYLQGEEKVVALGPTTLHIERGEFVAIVGPSGSGKSTMLSLLGGMLAPTSGSVQFDGSALYELSVAERAECRRLKMGFVFQTFNLIPYLTAQENVEVPLMLSKMPVAAQRRRAAELLNEVGLADRARHKPSQLSTGQQQRVALARTLAHDPCVILADEPTGNLDPQTRDHVLNYLDSLQRRGKTVIVVTHDPQVASRAARMIRLQSGCVLNQSPGESAKAA